LDDPDLCGLRRDGQLEDRLDLEEARRTLADPKDKKAIPWKKLREELGL
jgi:hypothetical protein